MKTFPSTSCIRWRRLDGAGHEEASIERTASGWRLTGQVDTEEAGIHADLGYAVECDRDWRTRRAVVTGSSSGDTVRLELAADGEGHWTLNGAPLPSVEGALDIDLGFTPATNLLPIRRLDLGVGEEMAVRTAWVRFHGEWFEARLETDEFGWVLVYEGLWEADVCCR